MNLMPRRSVTEALQGVSVDGKPRRLDYIHLEEAEPGRMRVLPSKPCWPTTHAMTPFMMRLIFKRLQERENDKSVSVVLFRQAFRRYVDCLYPENDTQVTKYVRTEVEKFGNKAKHFKMSWQDVKVHIDDGDLPKIPLTIPQGIFLTLEDFTTSWVALVYYIVVNIGIVANITMIIMGSMDAYKDNRVLEVGSNYCVYLFTFDYLVKAATVIFCPIGLFDEVWLVDTVTLKDSISRPFHSSKTQRFVYWATSATNVIDFLSILPFFLACVVTKMHVPLSSLRMLRLLRVIRVLRAFKAVGKWVTTLQVLGEAFADSLGSLAVLVVYIVLFSMVAGAILQQQESKAHPEYYDVPVAMQHVIEMFVGKSFSVSSSLMSGLILASVGMFKGFVFMLPLDNLKKATARSKAKIDEMNELREQVEQESHVDVEDWARDLDCPSVRARVFLNGTENPPAIGILNVPLHELHPVDAFIDVPLHGGPQRIFRNRPEIVFGIIWVPAADSSAKLPKGLLQINVFKGKFFAGYASDRWQVELEVPTKLYGEDREKKAIWMSQSSTTGAPEPVWDESSSASFRIDWSVAEAAASPSAEEKFRKEVLHLLQAQSKHMQEQSKQLQEQSKQIVQLQEQVRTLKK